MKLKYRLIAFIAIVGLMYSCDTEDDLIPSSAEESRDISLRPGRASAEIDARIEDLLVNTNTYFLYDFTEKEIKWNLVSGAAMGTVHLYENFIPTETENIGKQLDWIQTTFLDVYSDEFLLEFLPYKIYMVGVFTNSYYQDDTYQIAYSSNSLIFGFGNRQDDLSASDKYNRYNMEQNNYCNWLESKGKLLDLFDPKFFEVTDYSVSISNSWDYYTVPDDTNFNWVNVPTDEMLNSGVLGGISSWGDEAGKMRTDARNYYNYMRYFPEDSPQWERFLSFPKVKEKYDYFRNHCIENYSFDPHALGDVTFE